MSNGCSQPCLPAPIFASLQHPAPVSIWSIYQNSLWNWLNILSTNQMMVVYRLCSLLWSEIIVQVLKFGNKRMASSYYKIPWQFYSGTKRIFQLVLSKAMIPWLYMINVYIQMPYFLVLGNKNYNSLFLLTINLNSPCWSKRLNQPMNHLIPPSKTQMLWQVTVRTLPCK